MIQRISLEKIVKWESLKDKEYLIRKSYDCGRLLMSAEIRCKGLDSKITYVGIKRIKGPSIYGREEICLDDGGFPYLEVSEGPVIFTVYDSIFLTNRGFGEAMSNTHEESVLGILKIVKRKNHPIYNEFRGYIKDLIKKATKIKEAISKEYYFDDKKEIKRFSKLDLEVFRILALKDDEEIEEVFDNEKRSKYGNPDDYDVNNIKLNQNEEPAFIEWYRNYLITHGFKEKVEDPRVKENQALRGWINEISKNLEKNGFRRVKRFSLK